ncbi:hypothetical protein GCM10023328_41140 [Modestobacter marinus]|uniref:Excisionase family DNA binding protein n=2 Tax=Modestobacter marinus TaxID=477641 RepID=A0A846LQ36_9ACTN|nr:excisionase family DNA binding protein [Modestobacter marinus]GGL58393.1 hypothetical protein GCM10011589_13050 [Modestobacter marinus]
MSLPQRSPAPASYRPAGSGQPRLQPGVPVPRPAVRPAQPGVGVQPGTPMARRPLAPRPMGQQPPPRPVLFLTVAEVAAAMRVSKMTVYRLVHGGELAAVRVGRSFRVPESAVREYLAGARTDVA